MRVLQQLTIPLRSSLPLLAVLVASSGLAPVRAQCPPQWGTPGGSGDLQLGTGFGKSSALLRVDIAGVPGLIVGGTFDRAGGTVTRNAARWDGERYFAMPGITGGHVDCLVEFDAGNGKVLYAGGWIETSQGASAIARWTGVTWVPLSNPLGFAVEVSAMLVHDDGSGPQLYVGGEFSGKLARFDGSSWSAVGALPNQRVHALVTHDDGSGPRLYAGGSFTFIGVTSAARIAQWNGVSWSPVGAGFDKDVLALMVFDEGAGARLFAGGSFMASGGAPMSGVARWHGGTWSQVGGGTAGNVNFVNDLEVWDDGAGPALFAAGDFHVAGGVIAPRLARWNGSDWSAVGKGLGLTDSAQALEAFDDGSGEELYIGGVISSASGHWAVGIARWNGSSLLPVGKGVHDSVRALATGDLGAGVLLFVGGDFTSIGDVEAAHVASWDGSQWRPLGEGTDDVVLALEVFDDGSGPALYAAGTFDAAGGVSRPRIARWNGSSWSAVGAFSQFPSAHFVSALGVHDDGSGPALFAGGFFQSIGGVAAKNIARWNGSNWTPLGAGISAQAPYAVLDLHSFDDGAGPGLWVCGDISQIGGLGSTYDLGLWRGGAWSAPGNTGGSIAALASFDDGSGAALYVGGHFFQMPGVMAEGVARWNGSNWSAVGGGLGLQYPQGPKAMCVFDDGTGPALYVGGDFMEAEGQPVNRLARWNGSTWSTVGAGVEGSGGSSLGSTVVRAMVTSDVDGPARLWVGGEFNTAGGAGTGRLAHWSDTCEAPAIYCAAKASSAGCVPRIGFAGTPSATSPLPFTIDATRIVSQKFGLMIYGVSGAAAIPFMGGVLCLQSPIDRTALQFSGGNLAPDCSGTFALDFNALTQSGVDADLVPGTKVYAQYWYRDPNASFGSGLSDALSFQIGY